MLFPRVLENFKEMTKFEILQLRKNVLDVEERKYRNYFTTCVIIGVSILIPIVIVLLTQPTLGIEVRYILFISLIFPAILFQLAFEYRSKAEKKLKEINEIIVEHSKKKRATKSK
jgi:hypothetical protein